ncbi:hypothetical protein EV356DRAFT_477272 [Viridothelium virens]|uniref:F-box domain-containing protein n=1 Tax=Viridothelium virens TaxID=1048519 RepID=A0A6A6HPT3_VIRVR|nr:hypothetical protein EV356DRAFT_477272 [Viridothelium virens]
MQSKPSTASQNSLPEESPENTDSSTQYGLRELEQPAPPLSHGYGRGARDSLPRDSHVETSFNVSHQDNPRNAGNNGGRMNESKTPSPSPGNRITQYENAIITPPRSKSDGPLFEVIKTNRKPGDKRSPIARLPNEILTHSLSHLTPSELANVALVSRRFRDLVTSPHAWRTAFSRYFPGHQSQDDDIEAAGSENEREAFRSEKRSFTRLTKSGSWRGEYVLRTQLLRSLARGKPVQVIAPPSAARSGQSHTANAITMYNSQLSSAVTLLHGRFGGGLNKRSSPQFIHASHEFCDATKSDPNNGKVDNWGLTDQFFNPSFVDLYPGVPQWGLGSGEVVGVPNVMDASQSYGLIYGQGHPNGMVYYRSTDEMRGRFLEPSYRRSVPELGIPGTVSEDESICAVWIAKSSSVPYLSDGLIGLISGSSLGVVASYSLGPDIREHRHLARGELTARWVLCPGIPIIAVAVDEQYSLKRHAQNRIWAVVLNALGELFYLTKMPRRPHVKRGVQLSGDAKDALAWETGRSVCWNLVEPSRRTARPNPYVDADIDGSYTPRQSWSGMCLSKEQIKAETHEIEAFLQKTPSHFRQACLGWDMRRRMEVDFAGDDGNYAGENVIVMDTGYEEDAAANIKRYTRCKTQELEATDPSEEALPSLTSSVSTAEDSSLFGGTSTPGNEDALEPITPLATHESWSRRGSDVATIRMVTIEEWRTSQLTFPGIRTQQITASTLDNSTYALLTISEDPTLSSSSTSPPSSTNLSDTSSLLSSSPPSPSEPLHISPSDLPGLRARFLALGTSIGTIYLWDTRASIPATTSTAHLTTLRPLRTIYTESPSITSLGLTALTLIHGGADGLVQAWDPLASSASPIRTLNSRFSSRARRRLVQAQARPQGVGVNFFAAGAISLDPEPASLRGMVGLGSHLRYWSYSATAGEGQAVRKRRVRRGERRGSQAGAGGAAAAAAGVMRSKKFRGLVGEEMGEEEREREERRREREVWKRRFGTELLGEGASEEEMVAYARLLSEESAELEASKRRESGVSEGLASTPESGARADDELDEDLEEAIRLSLAEGQAATGTDSKVPDVGAGFDVPMRYAKQSKSSPGRANKPILEMAESSRATEADDLDFALQLSLAEEKSREEMGVSNEEDFPGLSPVSSVASTGADASARKGKGKGKRRIS